METGESPFAGAEREVEEETGLVMEATGVFSIEYKPTRRLRGSGYNNWIRYGITGKIVGGSLKTEVGISLRNPFPFSSSLLFFVPLLFSLFVPFLVPLFIYCEIFSSYEKNNVGGC